ncbi:MAG TPA: hypothetical protein VMZ71_16900, partial [Gemmataceae bacterium]|nr:hypothetical protein [Gemmataceae bacterium]
MREFKATSEPVWVVAFSPDGRHLVAGGGKAGTRVWDTFSTGKKPISLKNSIEALAVMFRADALVLVRRGIRPEVRAWPGGNVMVVTPYRGVWSSDGV